MIDKEGQTMNTSDYTRRGFLKTIGVGAASLAMSGCVSMGQIVGVERKRPNITNAQPRQARGRRRIVYPRV